MINPRHLIAVIVTKNFYKVSVLQTYLRFYEGRPWLHAGLPPRHRVKFAFRNFGQQPLCSFCQAAAGISEHLLKSTSSNSLQLDKASRSASAPAAPLFSVSLPKHLVEVDVGPKGSGTRATARGRLRYQGWAANKTDSVEHPPTCRRVFQYWL